MGAIESCQNPSLRIFNSKEGSWLLPCVKIPECSQYSRIQEITLPNENHNLIMNIREETMSSIVEGHTNEDSTLILPMGRERQLIAVLDGASSRIENDALKKLKLTPACYASHIVYCNFSQSKEYQSLFLREYLNAGDIMREMNSWLHSKLSLVEGVDYRDVISIPGMAATFCLFDAGRKTISVAHVADTVAFASFDDGEIKELTINQNEKFDSITLKLLQDLADENNLTPRQVRVNKILNAIITDQIKQSYTQKINTPNGCGILNGMEELISYNLIYETSIPITKNLRSIVLASDGAILPYQTNGLPKEAVVQSFLKDVDDFHVGQDFKFLQKGLSELLADPEYLRVLRLKPNDDATIIKVDFDNPALV